MNTKDRRILAAMIPPFQDCVPFSYSIPCPKGRSKIVLSCPTRSCRIRNPVRVKSKNITPAIRGHRTRVSITMIDCLQSNGRLRRGRLYHAKMFVSSVIGNDSDLMAPVWRDLTKIGDWGAGSSVLRLAVSITSESISFIFR